MNDDSRMDDRWVVYRTDDWMVGGEYRWGDAGTEDEPDWVWADSDMECDDRSEPVEWVAERVSVTDRIVRTYDPTRTVDDDPVTPDPRERWVIRRGTFTEGSDQDAD